MAPERTGPTIDLLLTAMLDRGAAHPDQIAILESGRGRTLTYGQLVGSVRTLVAQLVQLGLKPGDAVVYAMRPGVEAIVLLTGLLLAGANVIVIDPNHAPALFAQRMKLVAPRWIVTESIIYAASVPGPLRSLLRRRGLFVPDLRSLDARCIRVGSWLPGMPRAVSYSSLLKAPLGDASPAKLRPDRPALVVFTSGTTSDPKAVQHTAASLGASFSAISDLMNLKPSDVLYSTQTHQMLAATIAGATCIVPALDASVNTLIADVIRHGVTHLFAVPFELAAVTRAMESAGQSWPERLGTIVLAGAPVRPAFLIRLRKRCASSTHIWCVYAMTEMFPVSIIESCEKLAYIGDGDMVGTPVAGVGIATAPDLELVVSGPSLFDCYVGHDPVTSHATGDFARIDERRRIVLLGRKKDMIIRGHHNIYPELYESAIMAIPGVECCAFIGQPVDEGNDERLVLAIEPQAGEDPRQLQDRVERFLRSASGPVDRFAMPDEIVLCPVPRSGRSSKIDRRQLAQVIAAQLVDDAL